MNSSVGHGSWYVGGGGGRAGYGNCVQAAPTQEAVVKVATDPRPK
jgi:hypothetical protein